jgi:hypothetical protein
MARSPIAVQTVDSQWVGTVEDMTLTAADEANENFFVNNGKTRLFIKNGHSGSQDVVCIPVPDPWNRSTNKTVSTAAGKESWVGPFPPELWNQADGTMNLDIITGTNLELAVISDA